MLWAPSGWNRTEADSCEDPWLHTGLLPWIRTGTDQPSNSIQEERSANKISGYQIRAVLLHFRQPEPKHYWKIQHIYIFNIQRDQPYRCSLSSNCEGKLAQPSLASYYLQQAVQYLVMFTYGLNNKYKSTG